ncbi:zinc-binding dehydrogenase [Deinococcus yavapaiensis]|uniref:zinc-binding dehydrogenase n=1 Tax=Deinococcus yavapaiensis TaxID=309889 RepID=UPI000DA1498B
MRANGLQLERLNPLLDDGTIRPHVDRGFPFEQTPQAIAYAEEDKANGKEVIRMRPD